MLQNGVGWRTSNSSGPGSTAVVGGSVGSRGPATMARSLRVAREDKTRRKREALIHQGAAGAGHHQFIQAPLGQPPLRNPPQPPLDQPPLPKAPHGVFRNPPTGALRKDPWGRLRNPPGAPLRKAPKGVLRNAPFRNSFGSAAASASATLAAARRSAASWTSSGGGSAPSASLPWALAADTAALATMTVPAVCTSELRTPFRKCRRSMSLMVDPSELGLRWARSREGNEHHITRRGKPRRQVADGEVP